MDKEYKEKISELENNLGEIKERVDDIDNWLNTLKQLNEEPSDEFLKKMTR